MGGGLASLPARRCGPVIALYHGGRALAEQPNPARGFNEILGRFVRFSGSVDDRPGELRADIGTCIAKGRIWEDHLVRASSGSGAARRRRAGRADRHRSAGVAGRLVERAHRGLSRFRADDRRASGHGSRDAASAGLQARGHRHAAGDHHGAQSARPSICASARASRSSSWSTLQRPRPGSRPRRRSRSPSTARWRRSLSITAPISRPR